MEITLHTNHSHMELHEKSPLIKEYGWQLLFQSVIICQPLSITPVIPNQVLPQLWNRMPNGNDNSYGHTGYHKGVHNVYSLLMSKNWTCQSLIGMTGLMSGQSTN